ncbi:hypothetical protein [Natronobeatus ordinarius]|uniref:hypothetical protein n=1 Tax=Natronobeatus ordinarius TaxID=2963433 RepID=UPI0020CD8B0A|nr:hypothetical protein [Natronobeatus ordinarius]
MRSAVGALDPAFAITLWMVGFLLAGVCFAYAIGMDATVRGASGLFWGLSPGSPRSSRFQRTSSTGPVDSPHGRRWDASSGGSARSESGSRWRPSPLPSSVRPTRSP